MPARHSSLRRNSEGSGRRKRVSARHQVKRLDRISKEFASSSRSSRRNKLSSFGADAFMEIRNFYRRHKPGMKSGPDVFADALVPREANAPRAAHRLPGPFPKSSLPDRR